MNFYKWLQTCLNAHGAHLTVDGDWGRRSQAALEAFQKQQCLRMTGRADTETVAALRGEYGSPLETMPPWMYEMHRRLGLDEVKDNASLIDFLKIGRYLGNPKNLPWCGDAMESVIAKTLKDEPLPANPFFAMNWKTFGIASPCKPGAIGVIKWSDKAGHVTIVCGETENGDVIGLGGNQRNKISISVFPRRKFIAFRWPSTFPTRRYPALNVDGSEKGYSNIQLTR